MKKLLIITFVLSLSIFTVKAQDTWTQGYLTGWTAVNVGPGGINLVTTSDVDITGVNNNGWTLIYLSVYADVNTPDGDFGYFNKVGPDYLPTQGIAYPAIDYPDNTVQINNPVPSTTYYTINFQYYAVYQDSSLNLHYDYINQTIL
ncbi:hypothetical protein KXQ82_17370 [Mucilaginibacter sp. HMF5004]|uniref:hypothetical protein n=1 Tax=Mucilaginibacter rivuli TaxID=2857527 RepID=UPI001C5E0F91|nr:hypothetical protein [Mucilaginibacter rivuli]MBW4891502.1 hypothetical protein [Mucilaginibacter rivuli]